MATINGDAAPMNRAPSASRPSVVVRDMRARLALEAEPIARRQPQQPAPANYAQDHIQDHAKDHAKVYAHVSAGQLLRAVLLVLAGLLSYSAMHPGAARAESSPAPTKSPSR